MINRISSKIINYSHLWIGTFHSICFRLLQISGIFNGNIIDDYDKRKICDILQIDVKSLNIGPDSEKYKEYLLKYNYIDFDGILEKTLENIEFIKARFRFSHALIDEYQDTNEVQEKIINALAENLYCVGDDDQSIYSWRGSCINNILHFSQRYKNAKVYYLIQNYRCSENIITIANTIIHQNKHRYLKKMIASFDNNILATICYTSNEALFIAKTIQQLPSSSSIAILFRQNSYIANVETELSKNNISYKVVGGRQFFSYPEIKLAITYCKALFSSDILALETVLKIPKKGIGKLSYQKIIEYMTNYNLVDAIKYIKQYEYAELVNSWISSNLPAQNLFLKIWKESGCEEIYENNSNILLLSHKIGEYKTIAEFCINFLNIDIEEKYTVSLSTIHMAKGLEFDYVFMPFMIDGVFPNYRSFDNLEEERRIAYVGITRAKYKIFFSYSQLFMRNKISRFLLNLPRHCINYISF